MPIFPPANLLILSTPPGGGLFHESYGLRICHFGRMAITSHKRHYQLRRFDFFSLCHLLEGGGVYRTTKGEYLPVKPGQGIIVTPGSVVDYGPTQSDWTEDYICFVGPLAQQLQKANILSDGLILIGKTRRLLPIINWALDPSDEGQIQANCLLQKLLIDLYLERRSGLKLKESQIEKLCAQLMTDLSHWWTVLEMAEYCEMSVNHFRNLFKIHTGHSPKNYLDQIKINRAREDIFNYKITIESIAKKYGYDDPYHFSRVYKRVTGFSPVMYRKFYQNGNSL